jgi:hypothetical protein
MPLSPSQIRAAPPIARSSVPVESALDRSTSHLHDAQVDAEFRGSPDCQHWTSTGSRIEIVNCASVPRVETTALVE